MILEVAILDIKSGEEKAFESAFAKAQDIICSMAGYISHELQHCLEKKSRYILLVKWHHLDDHTQGFRNSVEYKQWKAQLHHFYEPFPAVEHYHLLFKGTSEQVNKTG